MNYGKFTLSLVLIILAGCQKNNLGETDAVQSLSVCSNEASSNGDIQIVGDSATEAGAAVTYSLNQNGNCVSSKDVAWKVAGASRLKATDAGLTSIFKRAGSYVVTAQKTTASSVQVVSATTTVVSQEATIAGPQVGFIFDPMKLSLITPSQLNIKSISWNFGDGSAPVNDLKDVEHTYFEEGEFQVKASVTDVNGSVTEVSHRVTTFSRLDDMACIGDLAITGASEAKVNVATALSIYVPPCLTGKLRSVTWNFGDGKVESNQNVNHIYSAVGKYPVTASLYLSGNQDIQVTLDYKMNVIENLDVEPDPVVSVDPRICTKDGETRDTLSDLYSKEESCGLSGKKTVSYHDRIHEECKLVGERLNWVEVSRSSEKTSEGACESQSCKLSDGSVLANGASKVLYSSSTPAGSCSDVSETRTCNNGILSGSPNTNQLSCHNGCGSFGSHGAVKTGVATGEIRIPVKCSFNEEGIFDLYTEISDQTCIDGHIVASRTRQGDLKDAGKCPVYKYVASDKFTECSANCGGKQARIFTCADEKGMAVDSARCVGQVMPREDRVCDANPDAVRRQESTTAQEEANSSSQCPKNQIGVISKTRDVVTTKTYACINHTVQLESEEASPGAWVEESYCRDYVAKRCSHDSLSNTQAKGRYDWMVKCQDQLPAIKEFLTNFSQVTIDIAGTKVSVGSHSRELYPTFMVRSEKSERPWIAPKNSKAACEMPASAYVATVCLSSCATPEQQILVEEAENKKLKYVSFIDALTQKTKFVAGLKHANSMKDDSIGKVKVDQWVTELIDTEHEILVFKMKSGRGLRVTKNHPVLNKEGVMKTADQFKAGDELVMLGGDLDPIVSITPVKHFGKVYNVFVQSSEIQKNILVTNGYLNGSAYFQNFGAKDMNRQLFRYNMTRGVFEK